MGTVKTMGVTDPPEREPVWRWRAEGALLAFVLSWMIWLFGCTTAPDAGWMPVCNDGDTVEAPCSSPEADKDGVVWPSTPIRLAVSVAPGSAVELEDAVAAVRAATQYWELRRPILGRFDLFKVEAEAPGTYADASVVINDVGAPADVLGDTLFFPGCGSQCGLVRTFNTYSNAQLDCVLAHELGHLLGLAHDGFGIMEEDVCASPDPSDLEDSFQPDLWVTDKDHRLLRDRYGR